MGFLVILFNHDNQNTIRQMVKMLLRCFTCTFNPNVLELSSLSFSLPNTFSYTDMLYSLILVFHLMWDEAFLQLARLFGIMHINNLKVKVCFAALVN